MKFATLLTPSSVYISRTIFKDSTMGPMIPKEMKYNLHYGKVRGDVLPPHKPVPWHFFIIGPDTLATFLPVLTKGQSCGLLSWTPSLLKRGLLCTPSPFWEGVFSKRKEFAPKGEPHSRREANRFWQLPPLKLYLFPLLIVLNSILIQWRRQDHQFWELCTSIVCRGLIKPLRKRAYSNILKILQPIKENFQIKNSDIFHIPA